MPDPVRPVRDRIAARAIALLWPALLLSGCATHVDHGDDAHERQRLAFTRQERERAMQQAWVGRSQQDLIQAYGPPSTVLGIPGARLPLSVILVYRHLDPVAGCIDAFVVTIDDDAEVWNYFCR